ncbi:unnamed protein product, partial [Rotaria sp. Silwood2]
MGAGNRSVDTA